MPGFRVLGGKQRFFALKSNRKSKSGRWWVGEGGKKWQHVLNGILHETKDEWTFQGKRVENRGWVNASEGFDQPRGGKTASKPTEADG